MRGWPWRHWEQWVSGQGSHSQSLWWRFAVEGLRSETPGCSQWGWTELSCHEEGWRSRQSHKLVRQEQFLKEEKEEKKENIRSLDHNFHNFHKFHHYLCDCVIVKEVYRWWSRKLRSPPWQWLRAGLGPFSLWCVSGGLFVFLEEKSRRSTSKKKKQQEEKQDEEPQ